MFSAFCYYLFCVVLDTVLYCVLVIVFCCVIVIVLCCVLVSFICLGLVCVLYCLLVYILCCLLVSVLCYFLAIIVFCLLVRFLCFMQLILLWSAFCAFMCAVLHASRFLFLLVSGLCFSCDKQLKKWHCHSVCSFVCLCMCPFFSFSALWVCSASLAAMSSSRSAVVTQFVFSCFCVFVFPSVPFFFF